MCGSNLKWIDMQKWPSSLPQSPLPTCAGNWKEANLSSYPAAQGGLWVMTLKDIIHPLWAHMSIRHLLVMEKKSLFLGHLRHLRIPNELCDKWEAKPQAKRCHLQIATQPGGVRGFWWQGLHQTFKILKEMTLDPQSHELTWSRAQLESYIMQSLSFPTFPCRIIKPRNQGIHTNLCPQAAKSC